MLECTSIIQNKAFHNWAQCHECRVFDFINYNLNSNLQILQTLFLPWYISSQNKHSVWLLQLQGNQKPTEQWRREPSLHQSQWRQSAQLKAYKTSKTTVIHEYHGVQIQNFMNMDDFNLNIYFTKGISTIIIHEYSVQITNRL